MKKINMYRDITLIFIVLFIITSVYAKTDNKEKNFLSVVKECTKKIDENNGNWYVYQKRGGAYFNLKQYKNAINDFNQSILLKNDNTETYRLKAKSFYFLKDLNAALKTINKAIKYNTKDRMLRFDRGLYLYELEKYNEAVIDFSQFIKFDFKPGDLFFVKYLKSLMYRGSCYYFLKKYEEAIFDFEKLLKFNIFPPKFIYPTLGECYFNLGKYKLAFEIFNKLIKENPNNSIAYMYIAWIYAKQKNVGYTRKYIVFSLEKKIEDPEAFYMHNDFIKLLGEKEIKNLIKKYTKE